MSLFQKIQTSTFWLNVAKIAIPFFIVVTLISIAINSGGDLLSGNFSAVYKANFAEGMWINFFSFKVVFSIIYGIWLTLRNTK